MLHLSSSLNVIHSKSHNTLSPLITDSSRDIAQAIEVKQQQPQKKNSIVTRERKIVTLHDNEANY
jgi:hypothetical protein